MDLLGKLFGMISGPKKDEKSTRGETSRYMPPPETPTDEKFLLNFKENGGKFLYCADQNEVNSTFSEILRENNWKGKEAWCIDGSLKDEMADFGLEFSTRPDADFCVLRCEYLVGNTGAVLLSSNQIGEKKLHDLPGDFVIFAKTSQLIETLSEGLRGIKARSQELPSNITTIKNFEAGSENEGHFMRYGSTSKNLYLLLLEDL